MVSLSLSLIGFQLMSKDFMFKVIVTLTFDLLTPKSIGIIYESWSSTIPRKVNPTM